VESLFQEMVTSGISPNEFHCSPLLSLYTSRG
jgi:hypothetical protein